MDMLEEQNPSFPIETISPKDVVIVLSGGLARPQLHLGGAGDRVMQAALLWRAGKAGKIIITGGNLPWEHASPTDSSFASELLRLMAFRLI